MKQYSESEKDKKGQDDSAPLSEERVSKPRTPDAAAGVAIDFHSSEFNRPDELNDYSGNYRSFQSLEGITTADMRHQMELRLAGAAADTGVRGSTPQKGRENEITPEAGEEAGPVTVVSEGRTLIIATDFERSLACGRLLSDRGLACSLLVLNGGRRSMLSAARLGGVTLLEGDAVTVTGSFGGFVASLKEAGPERGPEQSGGSRTANFDLVLDLQAVPAFAGICPPLGYYAPGHDPKGLEKAMAELPEMRGRFTKPRFISFREERCLRGRSRARDCRRCLEVCPFGAIHATHRKVSVNPYLCQGCGGCALVCPSDAIRRAHPSPEELQNALRHGLERQMAANIPATLVISDSASLPPQAVMSTEEGDRSSAILFEVGNIGQVGLELILDAFAHGTQEVVVACGPQNPLLVREAVEEQTQLAAAILRGLGLGEERIRFIVSPRGNGEAPEFPGSCLAVESDGPAPPAGPFSPCQDRRALIRQALRDLCARTDAPFWLPLPVGSPFGAVSTDPAVCTLCMACVSACPSGALSAGGDTPRLQFSEARCHQCGLCREICPEGAIRLLPGIHPALAVAEANVVVGQAEPFLCLECGLPFATRAMIDRMQKKLTGHWMYADERQLRRLQLCGTCRAADALASEDMKTWNRP